MIRSRSSSAFLSRMVVVSAVLPFTLSFLAAGVVLAEEPQPAISAISPSAGPAEGGTQVTISGSGFQEPVQVWFGGLTALDVNVFDDTTPEDKDRVTCITPDYSQQGGGPPIFVDLTVTNVNSGKSDTVEDGFIFRDAPAITSTDPSEGRPGDLVTIYGSGFEDPLWVVFPSDSGEHMEVVSVSAAELVVRMPSEIAPCEDTSGQFKIMMRETGEVAIGGDFTLLSSKPEIYSVTPATLHETNNDGGPFSPDAFTINGSNFAEEVGVRLGRASLSSGMISVADESTVNVNDMPDANDFRVFFDTTSCTTDRGTAGQRKLVTSMDVVVLNHPSGCGDILHDGLAVAPFDGSCIEDPVGDSVVPAAIGSAGARGTRWKSDFRFHNPCREPMEVHIEFQPTGVNNSGAQLPSREFTMIDGETRAYATIFEAIPDLVGDEVSGSLRIESSSASGCKVVVVSRTFNDTPEGTLGLTVPALLQRTSSDERLDFTGLIHDDRYRANLRLVNFGDADRWVAVTILDSDGSQLKSDRMVKVKGRSTRQVNDVASWLGVLGDLPLFSVRVTTGGAPIDGLATVIDNLTGDSVGYVSSFLGENTAVVAGAAHIFGLNDSKWRTDLWIYNPTESGLSGGLEYLIEPNFDDPVGFEWPVLESGAARQWLDIAGLLVEGEDSKGYLVVTGRDGAPAPQIAARTYSEDDSGGTYGLSLPAYGSRTLLKTSMTGFIVGISNSDDPDVGVRSNLALLNTDREEDAMVVISITHSDGSPPMIGNPQQLWLAPGSLYQVPASWLFRFHEDNAPATIRVRVLWGRGVAAYVTEIDNRTQDSIFISAQPAFGGEDK